MYINLIIYFLYFSLYRKFFMYRFDHILFSISLYINLIKYIFIFSLYINLIIYFFQFYYIQIYIFFISNFNKGYNIIMNTYIFKINMISLVIKKQGDGLISYEIGHSLVFWTPFEKHNYENIYMRT